MIHEVAIVRPDYIVAHERNPPVFHVLLNTRLYSELRFNGRAYQGCMPTHDGKMVEGEHSLRDWKTLARQISKAAPALDRDWATSRFGLSASSLLTERIVAAKSRQMDFFESIGILPGDAFLMGDDEKNQLLERYGEYLENEGVIPSF